MTVSQFRRTLALAALFLGLASCGPAPQAGGGIGGTGSIATLTTGPVTGFGSVFVSGKEFETTTAMFTVDGVIGAGEGTLKKGMIVVVDGELHYNYGTNNPPQRIAKTIVYEDTVEGIVQSASADGLSLTVLGQVVTVNQTTIIDPSVPGQDIRNLMPGRDLVEVSGFVLRDGHIVASFIDVKQGPPDYQAKGFVTDHDSTAKTFQVGSLTVDYATADISRMPNPTGDAWKGMLIDVRGDQYSSGGPGSSGVRLTASTVKPEILGLSASEEAEIEGFVTQVIDIGDFFIGNTHVQTGPHTEFNGGTAQDIVPGVKLEVEGSVANGILVAKEVEFQDSAQLSSTVATLSLNSGSSGTVTLVGVSEITVQVDSHTKIDGEGGLQRFDELRIGDPISIRGRPRTVNQVIATELKRISATTEVLLQGPIDSANNPALVLFGLSVDTFSIQENGFKNSKGITIGRVAFFKALSHSTIVRVKGDLAGGPVVWKEASLSTHH